MFQIFCIVAFTAPYAQAQAWLDDDAVFYGDGDESRRSAAPEVIEHRSSPRPFPTPSAGEHMAEGNGDRAYYFMEDASVEALGPGALRDETSGLILGDTVGGDHPRQMNYNEAMDYCINLNPESERAGVRAALLEGRAPHGIHLPTLAEFVVLRKHMGATTRGDVARGTGYRPQVLPHLNHGFWSSSVPPDDSRHAYYFNGRTGHIDYAIGYPAAFNAVRCVARR